MLIPFLKDKAKQPIYEDGPSWHMSKSGTPTMGGLAFVISITASLLICSLNEFLSKSINTVYSILICLIFSVLNSIVGIVDDITKLKNKRNAGLTPITKLIFQFILSALFLISRYYVFNDGTSIDFRFGSIDFGILYYPISLVILVGIINCANLTDGIDGLASSVAFAIGTSLFYMSFFESESATFICCALVGATVAFLLFNIHPAKIFMGDTGSLFLGALIAAIAFEIKNPFIAVISGGIYVIEGISVISQVLIYKMFKKRIFKMAPIHHHLEKCGWDENKICIISIIVTFILSAFSSVLLQR